MCLQCQQSSRTAFLHVIVSDVDGLHIVDEVLEVVTVCDDAILVPIFLLDLALNLFRIADAAGHFLFECVTVANQLCGFAAQCENASVAFTVENSGVCVARFKVSLVAADDPLSFGTSKLRYWMPEFH